MYYQKLSVQNVFYKKYSIDRMIHQSNDIEFFNFFLIYVVFLEMFEMFLRNCVEMFHQCSLKGFHARIYRVGVGGTTTPPTPENSNLLKTRSKLPEIGLGPPPPSPDPRIHECFRIYSSGYVFF